MMRIKHRFDMEPNMVSNLYSDMESGSDIAPASESNMESVIASTSGSDIEPDIAQLRIR
jgi:hypothetical protein